MPTFHNVRDALEVALDQHGPDACVLAGAVAEMVPPEYRTVAYDNVSDKLRTAIWPPPRCACELAGLAWRALPADVRSSVDSYIRPWVR